MILETLEFDGSTVLCRVCGDKASGFHYGVHACEGCKGFFRRSIQQKIQYRPCLKNQQCNIMRVNRNRCQYCRLKKCIAVGMSRDAVRFGRVPKKEKAKIMEQMKRVNAQSQMSALHSSLENDQEFLDKIIKAHYHNCDYTNEKVREMIDRAWLRPQFINCPAHMACPLNPKSESQSSTEGSGEKWEDFTEYFTPAIRNVVNFAKNIPGFQAFSQEDQVNLLKAGTFEVLLVHLAPFFDAKHNTMMFANGRLFKRASFNMSSNAGFLLDSMFDFSERMNLLSLTDEEMALFSAAVIVAADRPGLRNIEMVERVQRKIHQGLQMLVKVNHRDDPSLFPKLLMKIPDLRTLNTLHSEKLLGMTVAGDGQPVTEVKQEVPEVNAKVNPLDLGDGATRNKCPFSSLKPGSPDSRFPPVSVAPHQPFPLQFNPFAPRLPFVPSPDYRGELIHSAYASLYNGGPYSRHQHQHQQIPVFPQVKREQLGTCQSPPGSPKKNFTEGRPSSPSSSSSKDYLLESYDKKGIEESMVHLEPKSPILDVLHSDEDDIEVDINNEQELEADVGSSGSTTMMVGMDLSRSSPANSNKERVEQLSQAASPQSEDVLASRKRSMELNKHEIQTKISKLQAEEFDVRTSRSNSISSHTSLDSADSAYRTISSPSTPRSLVRSPPQTYSRSLLKDCLRAQVNEEPLRKEIVSSSSLSSPPKSERSTTSSLPVLKQALSIPPLVAQDSWFHTPRSKRSTPQQNSSELLLSLGANGPSSSIAGSDYSSQTSSRSGSPDELRRPASGKQFKLKTALLERFSPSCQEEDEDHHGNDSDRSQNDSPVSLKSRLLHRAEKDCSPLSHSAVFPDQKETEDRALDLQVHATSPSNRARTPVKEEVQHGHSSSKSSMSSFLTTAYNNIVKSHTASLASNHTVSSSMSSLSSPSSSSVTPMSSPASGHLGLNPVAPGYLGLAFHHHQQAASGRPPVHPALLYQYTAMQQQFKTLQQLEAQRLEQRSQPMTDHALNLALKKEPA